MYIYSRDLLCCDLIYKCKKQIQLSFSRYNLVLELLSIIIHAFYGKLTVLSCSIKSVQMRLIYLYRYLSFIRIKLQNC